jgi:hypothetical protein
MIISLRIDMSFQSKSCFLFRRIDLLRNFNDIGSSTFLLDQKVAKKSRLWENKPPASGFFTMAEKLTPEKKKMFISGVRTVSAMTLQNLCGYPAYFPKAVGYFIRGRLCCQKSIY